MTSLIDSDLPENAPIVLIGASGAGKSTLASTWPASQVLSLDALRGTVSDDPGCQWTVRKAMSVSGCGWSKVAGGDSAGYYFRAKLPVSASVRIPSLTRRFSLARVPSTFFGSSSWPRASQTSLARSGPVAWLKAARMRGSPGARAAPARRPGAGRRGR